MISNLITPPTNIKTVAPHPTIQTIKKATQGIDISKCHDAKECALFFVKNMTTKQKEKFKHMLEQGYSVGKSVADAYHVNHEDFMKAVKKII